MAEMQHKREANSHFTLESLPVRVVGKGVVGAPGDFVTLHTQALQSRAH